MDRNSDEYKKFKAEYEAKEEYKRDVENPERIKEREIEKARTEFSAFIRQVWFPICICDGEHKPTTIDFNRNISNVIANYFSGKAMQAISGTDIQKYLIYLRTGYRTAQGKPLAQKTIRHHYCTLANIFSYALKQEYILKNPMDKVDCPKLTKKKVDAFTEEEAKTEKEAKAYTSAQKKVTADYNLWALYDAIKQGAFSKYFSKEELGKRVALCDDCTHYACFLPRIQSLFSFGGKSRMAL